MTSELFYADLPVLDHFEKLANADHYKPIPSDWYVLITDIAGSTEAVEAGRYKDVNLLGAASIIVILNALAPQEIPFVFGGDGAAAVFPPSAFQKARDAALGARKLAREAFEMDLRVGIVPVATVLERFELKIAKYLVPPRCHQASFMGGGLTYATELVKNDPTYRLEVQEDTPDPDMSGLQCRWQDIPSQPGQVLSLIILAANRSDRASGELYREVFQILDQVYGDPKNYHPVTNSTLQISFNPQKLRSEMIARTQSKGWLVRQLYRLKMLFENLFYWFAMRFEIQWKGVDWGNFKAEVIAATDYQKIDDRLEMVIASDSTQTQQLQKMLDEKVQAGELFYGMHIGDRALMTCLMFEKTEQHLHLIDGADGGYTLAAKALKAQMNALSVE